MDMIKRMTLKPDRSQPLMVQFGLWKEQHDVMKRQSEDRSRVRRTESVTQYIMTTPTSLILRSRKLQ